MATMLAMYSWAPKASSWAAPTKARIRPTRVAISATMGRAPGPHCCRASQKSPPRRRARPRNRLSRARQTSPRKVAAVVRLARVAMTIRPRRVSGPPRVWALLPGWIGWALPICSRRSTPSGSSSQRSCSWRSVARRCRRRSRASRLLSQAATVTRTGSSALWLAKASNTACRSGLRVARVQWPLTQRCVRPWVSCCQRSSAASMVRLLGGRAVRRRVPRPAAGRPAGSHAAACCHGGHAHPCSAPGRRP